MDGFTVHPNNWGGGIVEVGGGGGGGGGGIGVSVGLGLGVGEW